MTDSSTGQQLDRIPLTAAEQASMQPPQPPEFGYEEWKRKCVALIQAWQGELLETDRRRRQRKIEVNLDLLRKQGRLKNDETFLAIRVIDENIRREQPVFMNYLRQPTRMAIFKNDQVDTQTKEQLEDEVTTGLQYSGWDLDYYGVVDGAQLHAWDAMEVMFDDNKPFKVSNEHIGHDDLLFPLDAIDIQSCAFIMRRYKFSPMVLANMVSDFAFDAKQVDMALTDSKVQSNIIPKNIDIYKLLFKLNKQVYVAWLEKDRATDWFKAPMPLDLGRKKLETTTQMVPTPTVVADPMTGQPVQTMLPVPQQVSQWVTLPEPLYPIKVLRYSQTEEKSITEQKGRAFYDLPYQEAATGLASLYVNGCVRASNVYASSTKGTGTGSLPKKMDMNLEHGCVYNEPIDFFSPPYPDPTILKGLQFIDVRKQQESGNLAAAVVNRDDSRKTAKELDVAESQTDSVKSVQLILFSNFMREILAFDWHIIQNLALQGLIPLLQTDVPAALDMNGMPTQMKKENNYAAIQATYDIAAAGDVDVIKRQERVQRRMMLLPMVQSVPPLAAAFMKDLLKEVLPEDADKYNAIIDAVLVQMAQQPPAPMGDQSGGGPAPNSAAQGQMNMQSNNMMSSTMAGGAQ